MLQQAKTRRQFPNVLTAIKARILVGIDRATSRIGQTAVRARHFMGE